MSCYFMFVCLFGFVMFCVSLLLFVVCIISFGIGNFGSLSLFIVVSIVQIIIGIIGFKCIGSLLLIFSINIIDVIIVSIVNLLGIMLWLYNVVSGIYLFYSICKDNGCGIVYNVGLMVCWSSIIFFGIFGLFNVIDGSLLLYLCIVIGVILLVGIYIDIIGLNWVWYLCVVGIGLVCVYDDGIVSSSVNVILMVFKDCFIDSVLDFSFGSVVLVLVFIVVNQNIGVCCILNVIYIIGFDNGNNFSGGWW